MYLVRKVVYGSDQLWQVAYVTEYVLDVRYCLTNHSTFDLKPGQLCLQLKFQNDALINSCPILPSWWSGSIYSHLHTHVSKRYQPKSFTVVNHDCYILRVAARSLRIQCCILAYKVILNVVHLIFEDCLPCRMYRHKLQFINISYIILYQTYACTYELESDTEMP